MTIWKRALSVVLAMVMLLSCVPSVLFASAETVTTTTPVITVENAWGSPGATVKMNVKIENNPGIVGASLIVTFDNALTLVSAEKGEAFEAMDMASSAQLVSPSTFSWDTLEVDETNIKDGVILTLTFEIDENATPDEMLGVSVESNGFYDVDVNEIDVETVDGTMRVINYTPGDLNNSGKIDTADVILLRRQIVGGYNINIVEDAADVNEDNKINTADAVLIRRYIVGGYDVVLKPKKKLCDHEMTAYSAKQATCEEDGNTAYWYCSVCELHFSDAQGKNEIALDATVLPATGHTPVIDEAVEPTYDSVGYTEGSHCSVCLKVLKAQEELSPLQKSEYAITYYISNNDPYLASLMINNPNPSAYMSEDGLVLEDLFAEGYTFLGWYDGASIDNSNLVKEIPVGANGKKVLYAQWKQVEYTVTFDSPDIPVDSVTYTVDKGVTLKNPSWFGYTFVGWSKDGKIVSTIAPGTTGNITLHANWTSNRNQAKAKTSLDDPDIIEDMDNGRYLFVYEIGTIENVPLEKIEHLGNSQGITIDSTYSYTSAVSSATAETIAKTVSNATTKTASWTISEEWNASTSATDEDSEEYGRTDGYTDSNGTVHEGKYYVSNVSGGETASSTNAGGAASVSAKITKDVSTGINGSYTSSKTSESSVEAEVSSSVSAEGFGAKAEVSASLNASTSESETKTASISSSRTQSAGTERGLTSDRTWDTSESSVSTWNSQSGYESSSAVSHTTELSQEISSLIANRHSYTSTEEHGVGNSETYASDESQELTDEYISAVEISTEESKTYERTVTQTSDATGYYRLVTAGTVHVFAIVGYDMATNAYFATTYSILDKERHVYLDYSKDNPNFNDCENAVLPFEVPFEVHEYISNIMAKSAGLVIDPDTGMITEYNGNAEYVVIPQYISVDNDDGTYSAIRVLGFEENVFKGKKSLKGVMLPKYVSNIPDHAFEGCTSLEAVMGYGITEIGDGAFAGCTNLTAFTVDKYIEALGENAFDDVPEINVMAANANVAEAAIHSGAQRITLNLSELEDGFDNREIVIGNSTAYFALIGNGSVYSNLRVDSSAAETAINNIVFADNVTIPLELNSAVVTLNRVTVDNCSGYAMILHHDDTQLRLQGTVTFNTLGETAAVSKNVTLLKANDSVAGKLVAAGDFCVYGVMTNISMLDGHVVLIGEDMFKMMVSSCVVTLDANGGIVDPVQVEVRCGQTYGNLPIPTRENYSFVGWYTASEGGTKVLSTATVQVNASQTLYAQWALNAFTVTFDPDGGTVSENSCTVIYGQAIGTMPTPTRKGYNFSGWYDAAGNQITATSVMNITADTTLYARWTVIAYTASWSDGIGYTIAVNRTSSPNAGASTGALTSGAQVYYGDVLTVTYAASIGYDLATKGSTSITVAGNVTSSTIYATATPNSYTYKIVYKSSNGTSLGSATATYNFGTTNTIAAKAFAGYTTPASQSVKWDSTTAKTITFTYTPTAVATSQSVASGVWWQYNGTAIGYATKIEYRNRTATSVQVRVLWTNTIKANHYYGYAQYYNATCGGVSTGTVTIASASAWASVSSSARSATGTSGWMTVPVNTTAKTTLTISGKCWDACAQNDPWSGTFTVPAY